MCHWPHEHGCTVTRVSQKANYSRFLLLSLSSFLCITIFPPAHCPSFICHCCFGCCCHCGSESAKSLCGFSGSFCSHSALIHLPFCPCLVIDRHWAAMQCSVLRGSFCGGDCDGSVFSFVLTQLTLTPKSAFLVAFYSFTAVCVPLYFSFWPVAFTLSFIFFYSFFLIYTFTHTLFLFLSPSIIEPLC